jgi:hypothetical protein
VLAVMSMASRGAPVMDGEVAELGHAWIKQIRGEVRANVSKLAS